MTAERDMILLDQLFNEYRFHLLTVFESIGIIVILILFISYEIYRRKTSKAEAELEIAKQQIVQKHRQNHQINQAVSFKVLRNNLHAVFTHAAARRSTPCF